MVRQVKAAVGIVALVALAAFATSSVAQGQPCPLPDDPSVLLDAVWPLVDLNGDGGISLSEIQALYPLDQSMFSIVDMDHNGLVTRSELMVILPLVESYIGGNLLGMIDLNGDQLIQYSEVSDYATPAQFATVDVNGNGVIDCEDVGATPPPPPVEGEGEEPVEGEGEEPWITENPCPLPDDNGALVLIVWPVVDTNGDGGISFAEFSAILPDLLTMPISPSQIFGMADANGDGLISFDELMALEPLIVSLIGESSLLAAIDANGNGIIEYAEVGDYVSAAQFAQMDSNGNGVIDCEDMLIGPPPPPVEGEGEIVIEGEEEGEPSGVPCPLPDDLLTLVQFVLPVVDLDGDGGLSKAEIIAIYPEVNDALAELGLTLDIAFTIADSNGDGVISLDEVNPYLTLVPVGVLEYVDLNGNGVIEYSEVADYATQAQFDALDANGNGVLDCEDLGGVVVPPPPVEGEEEGEPSGAPCPLPDAPLTLLEFVLPVVDLDGDGGLSQAEIIALYPDVEDALGELGLSLAAVFAIADSNGDGVISLDEVNPYLTLVPVGVLEYVDLNGNGVIEYGEVADYATQAQFDALDANGNGVLDCEDLGGVVVPPPVEGEEEGEEIIGGCPITLDLDALLDLLWPLVDLNGDGGISLAEVQALVPVVDMLPIVDESTFAMLDFDGDGLITRDEILVILPVVQTLLGQIDPNGNGVIEYAEVSAYVTADQFALVDVNGDGVLDCWDLDIVLPTEGEEENPGPGVPSDILQMLYSLFPMLDVNGDGAISLDEIQAVLPFGSDLLAGLDLSGDWSVTLEQLLALLDGGGGSFNAETMLGLRRLVGGNNFYTPGQSLTVRTTIDVVVPGVVSALGLSETLPDGWTLEEVVDAVGAEAVPQPGDAGTLEFAWVLVPTFPVRVVYRVHVPEDATGPQVIVGEALYRKPASLELSTGVVATAVGQGRSGLTPHSADSDADWTISLSEILRIVQFFNMGGYQCGERTEDGYAPLQGGMGCSPHDADYLVQDWSIDLSELLRMVQLFNAPEGAYYVDEGGEDGFAPGLFSLQ